MASEPDQKTVTARYDRIARFYDVFDKPMDLMGITKRRKRLLRQARGKTLEIGVGTGRNLGLYPDDVELTGIDASSNMLERARRIAQKKAIDADLRLADVQALSFDDGSFETVTATSVFCSVADPVAGLREVTRVVRPDGQVLLLEHVRPRNRVLGWLADRVAPLVSKLVGPYVNRRTEDNVVAAGLEIIEVRRWGVWREILARPASAPDGDQD